MIKNTIYYLLAIAGLGLTINYIVNHNRPADHSVVIDPRLVQYVEEWKSDMRANGFDPDKSVVSLRSVSIESLDDERLGNTWIYEHRIVVSPSAFEYGDATVRAVVYHELGHYVFGLEHGSCELMAASNWSNTYYSMDWERIKEEYIKLIRSHEFETHIP